MANNAILGEIDELFLQGACPMRVRKIPVLIGALLIALCGTGHALAQCNSGSVGFVSVGLVAGSPFQAERVTTMTLGEGGSAKTVEKAGNISRDRDGRIRSEQVTATYKVKRGDDIEKEVELKTILICDPVAQTLTQLDPLSKTAKVQRQQEKDGTTNTRLQSRNYCEIIFVFDDLEELGHRWTRSDGVEEHSKGGTSPIVVRDSPGLYDSGKNSFAIAENTSDESVRITGTEKLSH